MLEASGSNPLLPRVGTAVDFATGSPFPANDFWGLTGGSTTINHTRTDAVHRIWVSGLGGDPCDPGPTGFPNSTDAWAHDIRIDGQPVSPPGGYDVGKEGFDASGSRCYDFGCPGCTPFASAQICFLDPFPEVTTINQNCPVPWNNSGRFDPETDGVDLKYWSGNIEEYSLIIWRCPLVEATALLDYIQSCGASPSVCPANLIDNRYVRGVPSWVDEVVDGSWSGRLVILTNAAHVADFTENPDSSGDGTEFPVYNPAPPGASSLPTGALDSSDRSAGFLATLSSSLLINVIPVVRQGSGLDFDNPARIATVAQSDLTVFTRDEVGNPASYIGAMPTAFPGRMEGVGAGEGVFIETLATSDMKWIDYCDYWQAVTGPQTVRCLPSGAAVFAVRPGLAIQATQTTCGMRATIRKASGSTIDVVIVPDGFVCADRGGDVAYDEFRKQFIRNLFQVSVSLPS